MIKKAISTRVSPIRPAIQRPCCRGNPSLAIPHLPSIDQNKRVLKAVSHFGHPGQTVSASQCSSSTVRQADYFQFSKTLLECKTFFLKAEHKLIISESSHSQESKNNPSFDNLINLVNNHQFLSTLPASNFEELLLTITEIFELTNSETIPNTLIYSDAPVYVKFSYNEELNSMLQVFSIVLATFSFDVLQKYITEGFIRKFIKKLSNPNVVERKMIEGIILQIENIFNNQRYFILNCLLNLLQDHIDHLIPYFCVGSVLKCISTTLSFQEIQIETSKLPIILYLFNSYFLSNFNWELDIVLKKLYRFDPSFGESVRSTLIFNWPNKDSKNSFLFLSFYLNSLFFAKIIDNKNSTIVSKFFDCILSTNASNALQAINFAGDPNVYKIMIQISPNFYDELFKNVVKKISVTWSPFINQAIIECNQKIKSFEETAQKNDVTKDNPKRVNKNKKCSWDYIKKLAHNNN